MKDKQISIKLEKSDFDMDDLKKELEEENNFLIKLVDTIPAKMYFDYDIQEKIAAERHSAMDKAAEEINIELSAKGKHKRARLDPLNQKSVSQIHGELNKQKRRKKKKQKGELVSSASLTRATNIEELQKRLQERISLFQAKRKAAKNDATMNKRLKTKVKKLKQKGNKLKAQESNKIEKTPKKNKHNDKHSSEKPVFNKDSNFIYSKFDFSENGLENSKRKDEYTGKKVKTLLRGTEKKREKIELLKNIDPEKAESMVEKEKWKKAILKSEGVKVRDDPALLKKSLKSEEKRKKKSAKVWKERIEETEKKKKAHQDKRNRHIKERKKDKLDHKLKLARKKGRIIPGF